MTVQEMTLLQFQLSQFQFALSIRSRHLGSAASEGASVEGQFVHTHPPFDVITWVEILGPIPTPPSNCLLYVVFAMVIFGKRLFC